LIGDTSTLQTGLILLAVAKNNNATAANATIVKKLHHANLDAKNQFHVRQLHLRHVTLATLCKTKCNTETVSDNRFKTVQ